MGVILFPRCFPTPRTGLKISSTAHAIYTLLEDSTVKLPNGTEVEVMLTGDSWEEGYYTVVDDAGVVVEVLDFFSGEERQACAERLSV